MFEPVACMFRSNIGGQTLELQSSNSFFLRIRMFKCSPKSAWYYREEEIDFVFQKIDELYLYLQLWNIYEEKPA